MLNPRTLSNRPLSEAPRGAGTILRAQAPRGHGFGIDQTRVLTMAESVANMGYWQWNPATDAMTWSDHIWRMVGLDPARHAPTLSLALEVTHPDDRADVERRLNEASGAGLGFEFDLRIVHSSGDVRTVIAKGQPEFRDGKVMAMFGVLTDVTEAFAAINAIREQHEMLDLAAEIAQLGHWVWNCDENAMSFCSDELARLYEMPVEAFRTRFQRPEEFADAITPEYRDSYLTAVRRALTHGEPYALEYRLTTPDGYTVKDIREIGHPFFDEHAGFKRVIGTVQDITDTKRRENELGEAKRALEAQAEALRRSELKFRDIIEGSIQGIVILRDFHPVFANQAYARLLGLPGPEDVMSLGDLRQVMAPDAAAETFWNNAMNGQLDGKTRRAGIRTIDGRLLWTDSIGRLIEWEGEPAFLVTVIDVTEQHLAEQQLQKKTKELQELNLQKDKLFSIIAHDLKGPFNAVIGFADLLAARAAVLSTEKVTEYARIVRDAATSVHGLFDNLLTWAAFQLRDAAPRFCAVDVAAAVNDSIQPLLSLGAEKGVIIVNDIPDTALGVHVLADEDLLCIVLRNLVSNGIKFSHAGGEVRVSASGQSMVRVTVRDTGVGMAEDEVANLFRLDRTVSVPGTRGERGTGLGLYLCRDIVARHGGAITAEATPGEGTAFHFTLPRAFPKQRT